MGFIDCDSHVTETDETWDHFDPSERAYRPMRLHPGADQQVRAGAGTQLEGLWLVGDAWAGVFPEDGIQRGNGNRYDPGALTLREPGHRIAELDALGIDVQVLQSSLFLVTEIQDPFAEAAIKRSWNRWMAERLAGTDGRLAWIAEVPCRTLTRAEEEMTFAKEHGAVGVRLHGIERGLYLDHHYFDPLFARAQELDLTIVSHIGRPATQSAGLTPVGTQFPTLAPYVEHVAGPMTVFWTVLTSDLHERFPRLRFCLNECGATWSLALINHFQRVEASRSVDFAVQPLDPEVFATKNLFVSCFVDESIGLLVAALGSGVLVVGTDYGHNDLSSQIVGHTSILGRADITPTVARAIVDVNGRRAFAIDEDLRPSDGADRPSALPYTRAVDLEFAGPLDLAGIGV